MTASFASADLVIEPKVEHLFGSIQYDMDFPFPAGDFSDADNLPGLQSYGRSLLSFPVDGLLAGITLRWGDLSGSGKNVFVSAATNWTDPMESMLDKDWIEAHGGNNVSNSKAYILISDTKSRARLNLWKLEAGQQVATIRFKDRDVRLGWHVGFDHYAADVFGIKGWQGNKVGGTVGVDYVEFDTLADVKVLTYEAVYLSPGANAATEWIRGRHVNLEVGCKFSPATFAFDKDDHLLREKNGRSWAVGLDGVLDATLAWHSSPLGLVRLGGQVGYTKTWGLMTQKFYGISPEAEEGNRQLREVGDIHNSLGRLQYSIFLTAPFAVSRRPSIEPIRKGAYP